MKKMDKIQLSKQEISANMKAFNLAQKVVMRYKGLKLKLNVFHIEHDILNSEDNKTLEQYTSEIKI